MGCCHSSPQDAGQALEMVRNQEIDTQIKQAEADLKNEVKLLLLGAGESGKSTVIKQMKLIHEGGYSAEEKDTFKSIIYSNTIQSMKVIMEAMDAMEVQLEDAKHESMKKVIENLPEQVEDFPQDATEAIRELWKDGGVQQVFERSREYQLNDSARYFFNSIDRIGAEDYVPTDQDVLRARVKTTGISETTFDIQHLKYRMFDVGGQRSERKKWIHCFDNVMAVIFLVALSEFDQVLIEDGKSNRMDEALILFDQICNSKWFKKTSMILFLNKIDIFKEKIAHKLLSSTYSDYTGPNTYEETSHYLMQKFLNLNKQPARKHIYTHFTCATDTEQMKFVMAAVNDIIIQINLRDVGLI